MSRVTAEQLGRWHDAVHAAAGVDVVNPTSAAVYGAEPIVLVARPDLKALAEEMRAAWLDALREEAAR